jgi:fatty-acyl-CoA synthase
VHIAERAATPKEVLIVESMPLTDVGKPIKAALRREVAERTFRAVLSEALGPGTSAQLQVAVRPHQTHGTLASILVTGAPTGERDTLAARIEEIMDRYSFAYILQFG